jgi:hypothetical protein
MNNENNILSINSLDVTILNYNGTNHDQSVSSNNSVDTPQNKEKYTEYNKNNINNNIYRYKFSNLVTEQLFSFSKIHQYDDRASFKDAWKEWIKENNDLVEIEVRRLQNLHYEGDIIDKMFKSARYYFRKKNPCIIEPKKRGTYLTIQKELLDAMDKHISTSLINTKPSERFDDFCIQSQNILKEEIIRLMNGNSNNAEEIKKKIKKTYKNRYFLYNNKK